MKLVTPASRPPGHSSVGTICSTNASSISDSCTVMNLHGERGGLEHLLSKHIPPAPNTDRAIKWRRVSLDCFSIRKGKAVQTNATPFYRSVRIGSRWNVLTKQVFQSSPFTMEIHYSAGIRYT